MAYNQLELREIFHLIFLRYFASDMPSGLWALKGGVNLRLFFKSIRYSEDMDIDVQQLPVDSIKKRVIRILKSPAFLSNLKTYGIEEIQLPDMSVAKQTSVTQRFKVHLLTSTNEDYFTKIEFSRRGLSAEPIIEAVPSSVLRPYSMSPLLVPHYTVLNAIEQKINAVLSRTVLQARDVFDLYLLSSQTGPGTLKTTLPARESMLIVRENILHPGFQQFLDSVAAYLPAEERRIYSLPAAWDEVKLKVLEFITELEAAANE